MPDDSGPGAPSDASYTLVVDLISSAACAAPTERACIGGSNWFRIGGGAGLPAISRGSYSRYAQFVVFAVAQRVSLNWPLTPIHGALVPSMTVSASLDR